MREIVSKRITFLRRLGLDLSSRVLEKVEKTIQKGIVFDVKRYATDDGPGIRTTVFFKGCPLHCWWCHNPEGQGPRPELMYKRSRCKGSGECAKSCPKGAISKSGQTVSVNRKLCDSCGKCTSVCPTGALIVVGKVMTVDEILREIEQDVTFYDESGGGVTFSGGEPLMQPDFLDALLEGCRKKNIHTALDTCGFAPWKTVDTIRDKVDLFLYDIKTLDSQAHRKYTRVSNKLIIQNFRTLAEKGSKISIRFPVIPGFNDDEKSITRIGEFALSHAVKQICLLPYHRAGIEKYRNLDRAYRLEDVPSPGDQKMQQVKERLVKQGLDVRVGGE
jgi:pyruvate formate lyase activating enzyme